MVEDYFRFDRLAVLYDERYGRFPGVGAVRGIGLMTTQEDEYVTVTEAATQLRVAPSTIRRWIREGGVPAYRLGQRRVVLRRTDLGGLITPIRPDAESVGSESDSEQPETPEEMPRTEAMELLDEIRQEAAERREHVDIRRPTPEEIQQAREAMARARKSREEITARRGGEPFPPSWMILNELRDERTRQLMGE
jgi:excisionase family DNA binding protein